METGYFLKDINHKQHRNQITGTIYRDIVYLSDFRPGSEKHLYDAHYIFLTKCCSKITYIKS